MKLKNLFFYMANIFSKKKMQNHQILLTLIFLVCFHCVMGISAFYTILIPAVGYFSIHRWLKH